MAAAEEQLRAALPAPDPGAGSGGTDSAGTTVRELWLAGSASPQVRDELRARGWQLHEAPADGPAPPAAAAAP